MNAGERRRLSVLAGRHGTFGHYGIGLDWRCIGGHTRPHRPRQDHQDRSSRGCGAGFLTKMRSANRSASWSIYGEVTKKLADQLHLTSLAVTYVAVAAADRFAGIQQHKADLLCEPTSAARVG